MEKSKPLQIKIADLCQQILIFKNVDFAKNMCQKERLSKIFVLTLGKF